MTHNGSWEKWRWKVSRYTCQRADYARAAVFLGEHGLGLRAGDALHLAVAYNEGAGVVYSLDQLFIAAGRESKINTERPI